MHAIRQRGGVAVAGCLDGSGASQNKPIPTGAKPLKKWRVRPDQRRALQVMATALLKPLHLPPSRLPTGKALLSIW